MKTDAGPVFFLSCTKRSRVLKGKYEPTTESYGTTVGSRAPTKNNLDLFGAAKFYKKGCFFLLLEGRDLETNSVFSGFFWSIFGAER